MEKFDFLATVLVRDRGGIGKRGSISDGWGIRMSLWLLAGVIAGATGIGDRGGLWAATVGMNEFSEEGFFSELLEVCTVDPVSFHFDFFPKLVDQRVN